MLHVRITSLVYASTYILAYLIDILGELSET